MATGDFRLERDRSKWKVVRIDGTTVHTAKTRREADWLDGPNREHLAYLEQCERDGLIPLAVAALAREVWKWAWDAGLPVPAACTGPDGQMQYVWDAGPHHLSADIHADVVDWFHRNRDTEWCWSACSWPGDDLSASLDRRRFVADIREAIIAGWHE